jgi:predicted NBD/HSP70 family sugar kinase
MIEAIRLGAPAGRPDASVSAPLAPPPLAHRLLRLVWEEREISRAEIARRAALSRSTVSEGVTPLLASGLVLESGTGASRGGRRPIVLAFQDEAHLLAGVDVTTTGITVVLTNLRGERRAVRTAAHDVEQDPAGTRGLVAALLAACLQQAGEEAPRLLGIGVAVPSPVDPRHPERLHPLSLPAWRGRHGLEALLPRFGVPVFIDNDANLGALAERWWGAARGVDDFTYIKLATGVGSGHMMAGRIYRGGTGVAGEIGHLTIDPHGPPCNCGNRGCLGTYVGAEALVARARALLPQYPGSPLAAGTVTAARVEAAAEAGDPLAVQVMHEVAEALGIAVAGVLNLLNPQLVILDGGLARLEEQLLQPLRETVFRRTFVSAVASATIRSSTLGAEGVALGAAALVLAAALRDPLLFPSLATPIRASGPPPDPS